MSEKAARRRKERRKGIRMGGEGIEGRRKRHWATEDRKEKWETGEKEGEPEGGREGGISGQDEKVSPCVASQHSSGERTSFRQQLHSTRRLR